MAARRSGPSSAAAGNPSHWCSASRDVSSSSRVGMLMDRCVSRAWLRIVAAIGLVAVAAAGAEAQRVTAVWDANTDPHTIGYRLYIGVSPNSVDSDIDVGN